MRIAIVGAGVSGLTAAYLLSRKHDVTVYEAEPRLGGHTHTIEVDRQGRTWPVDTGFIVFNQKTYPNFVRLMKELGVSWQRSNMSFSVSCQRTGLEFSPSTLAGLMGAWQNLCWAGLWRLPLEVERFKRCCREHLQPDTDPLPGRAKNALGKAFRGDPSLTLGRFLKEQGFSRFFRQYFLLPMGASIWSAEPKVFAQIPALFFSRFFRNHGILDLDQPTWLTLRGGSHSYLKPLSKPFQNHIHLSAPVQAVTRGPDSVSITVQNQRKEFDQIVLACHSDQALSMLTDPSSEETAILGAVPYQPNEAALHTDATFLPRRRAAWASWNYRLPKKRTDRVILTYAMNRLQNLSANDQFCVTLNATASVAPQEIIRRLTYAHPVFTPAGISAQKRWEEINGPRRTWFAGAYWRYGFHEDGVISGLRVARALGCDWP